MKIMLTGGGTGGHFYPLIAIAQKLNEVGDQEKIANLKIYYMSDAPYDERALFDNKIEFIKVETGKIRLYFSFKNISDIFKTISGVYKGFLKMFKIYPDVVISKGGYASFPAVLSAIILRIPIIVHESDSYPGKANLWASKFARRVAVSWPEAVEYLPKDKTALTGQPIRKEILKGDQNGAFEYFKLSPSIPTILVIGGSQGAEKINDIILDSLPQLLNKYQIIHQTGPNNIIDVSSRAKLIMENNPYIERYVPIAFLNINTTKMSAGVSKLIISRAGSAIFEIASWGIPSILIPITKSNGNHQKKNAYNYARTGASKVIEEENLTPHVLISEIDRLLNDTKKLEEMKNKALAFSNPDASLMIAKEAIEIALTHEE
ncbi:TPA: UDP-N-acetylglucosamine--N-acetylmuramyl-(pentapeptide) pyrophosphoryl-undecaprenol N-acetylglucosamine transferase [Candidatus Nomurabacteria bacterium]|nr:MAG: UDP diphospho-muramoyl pentapeptide beta-N acetylglucosaminyl transferase [Parcubacteria bacterium RAAC4_OD1_1]HCY26593.1 UDP-N-acetylglucosamine--N-acetylmuramyl-(pentapeptide) pyrophosphoryl-undecaprenol N-acetylglucosamine transferase [Candidatus Nomurabacteria bacterium]